jgi:hypothetical protein
MALPWCTYSRPNKLSRKHRLRKVYNVFLVSMLLRCDRHTEIYDLRLHKLQCSSHNMQQHLSNVDWFAVTNS